MENFKRKMFEKLGSLFYAIAMDQNVSPIEFGELSMLTRNDWLTDPTTDTNLISEPSHLIILTMDSLLGQAVSAENSFRDFTGFYTKHREQFSDALKDKIVDTANRIVDVFSSPARLQNNLLVKLNLLFQNSTLIPSL